MSSNRSDEQAVSPVGDLTLPPPRTPRQPGERRCGRYLGLFDEPLYVDWIAWLVALTIIGGAISVTNAAREFDPSSGERRIVWDLALYIDLGVVVLVEFAFFGLVPASIRAGLRRLRGRRPESGFIVRASHLWITMTVVVLALGAGLGIGYRLFSTDDDGASEECADVIASARRLIEADDRFLASSDVAADASYARYEDALERVREDVESC